MRAHLQYIYDDVHTFPGLLLFSYYSTNDTVCYRLYAVRCVHREQSWFLILAQEVRCCWKYGKFRVKLSNPTKNSTLWNSTPTPLIGAAYDCFTHSQVQKYYVLYSTHSSKVVHVITPPLSHKERPGNTQHIQRDRPTTSSLLQPAPESPPQKLHYFECEDSRWWISGERKVDSVVKIEPTIQPQVTKKGRHALQAAQRPCVSHTSFSSRTVP